MTETDYKKLYRRMLEDYFSGRLDEEFAGKVRAWIPESEHPDEANGILREQFDIFVRNYPSPDKSTHQAWKRLCRELGIPDRQAKRRTLTKMWLRVAAVVIPLLIITGSYFILNKTGRDAGEPVVAAVDYSAQFSAPGDGKKRISLPDGTEIYLNAGATVAFDSLNYLAARNIKLHGEAYFSVARDEALPFVVHAGDITVTVLGTEFNVRTSESDGMSEVSLFSGSVEVRTRDKLTLLQPNQQLIWESEGGITLIRDFDKDEVGNWRTRLDLDNVTLQKAFSMIEDYFGVPVRIEGKLPEENKIRVSFKEPTIDEAIDILHMITSGFDYRIEGDTVRVCAKR